MKMRLAIVDSNESIRNELWSLLALERCFELDSCFDTTEDALAFIDHHELDVVFVNNQPADVERTSQGCFLATILNRLRPNLQVVIYGENRVDAYQACRAMSAGFLLYPFDILDVQQIVRRVREYFALLQLKRETEGSGILIKTRTGYHLVRLTDVLFIERISRTNRIVMEDGTEIELMGYSMGELETMLTPYSFFRCHQSYLVNLKKVSAIDADNEAKRYLIKYKSIDGEITVSREKYTEILELLREKYAKLER